MHLFTAFLLSATMAAAQQVVGAGIGRQPAPPPAPSKPEDLCTLEGVVVNSATGEPIAKTQILLSRIDRQERPYSSTSDGEGKFILKGIEPGQYRMSASRNGYVRGAYGARGSSGMGTALTLSKAQTMKNLEFKLIPHAVVTGRVIDSDGEPVPYSQVTLLRSSFLQGRRQMMPAGNAMTNDLGEYRMFSVPPGNYVLIATARNDEFSYLGSIDASGRDAQEVSSSTYYPNVLEAEQAAKIAVAQGTRLQGLDVRLLKARAYKVSGHVSGQPGRMRNISISLNAKSDSAQWMGMGRSMTQVQPNGSFEIRGVRPGVYSITAFGVEQDVRVSGRSEITVTNANVENAVVNLAPGFDVSGVVKIEGAPAEGMTVMLEPRERAEMFMGMANGVVKEDGSFQMRQVSAAVKGMFRAARTPDGYYVKSAKYGEVDLLADEAMLTPGGVIEVTMAAGAAKIEGTVLNDKGAPATGVGVVAIPTDNRARATLRGAVTTDQAGRYTIKNLPPGEYSLVAIDGYEFGMEQDPEFPKTYQSAIEKVVVKESAVESKPLKAVKALEP